MPISFLLVLLFLLWGWWCWQRRDLLIASWKLPGPIALPFVGCAHLFICRQEEIFGRILKLLASGSYSSSPLLRFWIGTKFLLIIQSPKLIEEVLKNPDLQEKGDIMKPTKVIFGEGIITGSGPKWRSHKKAIVQNFSPRVVEKYITIFQSHGEILLELLRPSAEREERISIDKYLHACCFDIVSETLIGHKSKTQFGENLQLADDSVAVYQSVFQSMVQPWRQSVQRALGQCFDDDYSARIREYFQTAIDKKRAEMRSSPEPAEELDAAQGWSTLERLERAHFTCTDKELCYEFSNLFIASFDTVALIVSFVLRMLAMYPEHQKRAAEEAVSAGGAPARCGAGELPFLERCVLETIRLFPILPFFARACRKTLYLSDGTMIPGGSTILIFAFSTHRLPAEWEEPLHFHPDRFLPGARRHPFSYIPFSYGARGCVGKTFAMMCCKSLLCQILHQFEFSCDPAETIAGMNLSCDISVREIGGSHVTIRTRQGKA